jgi:DNA (cytosine-5)-methyltransferase 1
MGPRFVDLFCGVGGFSVGLERAGYTCVAGIESDPAVAACFVANHAADQAPVVFSERIQDVSMARMLEAIGLESEGLDLLVGGPPCQGFSTIGKRRRGDDRNRLVYEYIRFLEGLRPTAFVMENVPGILTFNGGRTVREILKAARKAGYKNARVSLVDATTCGVPQKRVRVLIYGTRNGTHLPDLGDGTQMRPRAVVGDALCDLPDPWEAMAQHQPGSAIAYASAPSAYAAVLRGDADGVTRWEPVKHTDAVVQGYAATAPGKVDPRTKCYRLMTSMPARTLRAGCKGRTACRPIHPAQSRVVTVREAARIQSFPDTMILPKPTSAAHRAIGNAVPPLLAESIGARLLEVGF